jgi:hypothetical protein
MKKPANLREHLMASVPLLADNPDRLLMFIEGGSLFCQKGDLSFMYRFTLKVFVTDYSGDTDLIMVPLLQWLHQNQVDLLDKSKDDSIRFEAEPLNHNTWDVEITLPLTESVLVNVDENNQVNITHKDEAPLVPLGGLGDWDLLVNDKPISELQNG